MAIKKDNSVELAYQSLTFFLDKYLALEDKESDIELKRDLVESFEYCIHVLREEAKMCVWVASSIANEIKFTPKNNEEERESLRRELEKMNNRREWLDKMQARVKGTAESLELLDEVEAFSKANKEKRNKEKGED